MIRDQSLHIRKSDLVSILNGLRYDSKTAGKRLADMIFQEAQPYQITDRYSTIIKQTSKVKAKAVKSMDADSGMPDGILQKFNMLLTTFRQSENINARVRVIRKDSKDYILLKEVARNAYDFATSFNFRPIEDGLKKYIEMGIGFMGKYSLNRFKTYHERVFEEFENELDVLLDDDKAGTENMLSAWNVVMAKWVGEEWYEDLKKDFKKYVHILYARKAADSVGAAYEDWIEAQFDGLAFLNVIPELSQLYGENAKRRYDRFCNKVEVEEEQQTDRLGTIYKNQIDEDDE